MKKSGIALLVVGVLVILEALIKGQGTVSLETTIFSLTLFNLAYIVYTKGEKKSSEEAKIIELEKNSTIIEKAKENSEEIQAVFSEGEERDRDFVRLINKFSNLRIESILENTKDQYKKRELQRVLNKRRGILN